MSDNPLRDEVRNYVENHIAYFHDKRIESLNKLKIDHVLKRKNPYLFRAKNIVSPDDFIDKILEAHLSSHEETIFGNWLEELAIFVCSRVYGGRKSSAKGIDLEFDSDGIRYLVSIKSGPNWGNSSQIRRLSDDFKAARKILNTSNSRINVRCVNGCCYGNDNGDRGDYIKLCGQDFWKLISNNDKFYIEIVEPIGIRARERNEIFYETLVSKKTLFIKEFINSYCTYSGSINWEKIIDLNSGRKN
ncbi:MAG: cytosolic protein [Bacteroidetes bacterium]|jgi:hypothetical protein|nr:cytosolic protein [Bacteroidota bacterium]